MLGCDLSAAGVSYARGVASRWGMGQRCHFVRDDARAVLRAARRCYPGGAHRVILSCPTPYAQLVSEPIGDDGGDDGADTQRPPMASGNGQLPSTADDPGFLGHADVLGEIHSSLAPGGQLYLASNVEDVALTLLHTAERCGFEALLEPTAELPIALGGASLRRRAGTAASAEAPRRQQRWRATGGERAEGACWQAASHPQPWASETERTHGLEGRLVHRVVLQKAH